MAKKPASSILDTLKRYIKKPWEFTGPQSHPEYRNSILPATQYRVESPASTKVQPWVPTSNPETVFDIKYYTRDQRRNRPPIRRTVLKKADTFPDPISPLRWRRTWILTVEGTRNRGLDCGEMVVLRSSVCFSLSCSLTEVIPE
nr:hypothetical protein CFP56_57359 [Quercus suber]